ncbi:MAG: ATP-binding protein involved in chromosome partitioning, partial [Cryptosporangiaceae bacterium]|nr:ATP-binding protein involved in chromosome partitioning [Cryptosporangiaceae bacterium]
ETMSWLELPGGDRMEVFGSGGGEAVAAKLSRALGTQVPLLGQIPLEQGVREGGDSGVPYVLSTPDAPAAIALREVAERLAIRQRGLAGRSLGLTPA